MKTRLIISFFLLLNLQGLGQNTKSIKYEQLALIFFEDSIINKNLLATKSEVLFPLKMQMQVSYSSIHYYCNQKKIGTYADSLFPNDSFEKPNAKYWCDTFGIDSIYKPQSAYTGGKTSKQLKLEGTLVYNILKCRREFKGSIYVTIECIVKVSTEAEKSFCSYMYIFEMSKKGNILGWIFYKDCIW